MVNTPLPLQSTLGQMGVLPKGQARFGKGTNLLISRKGFRIWFKPLLQTLTFCSIYLQISKTLTRSCLWSKASEWRCFHRKFISIWITASSFQLSNISINCDKVRFWCIHAFKWPGLKSRISGSFSKTQVIQEWLRMTHGFMDKLQLIHCHSPWYKSSRSN